MKKLLFLILLLTNSVISQNVYIKHNSYEICFNMTICEPNWTHYVLTSIEQDNNVKRSPKFKPDPLIDKDYQASDYDYIGSGFDRGHLSPNDDFRFDSIDEKESMYFTNTAPQYPSFNRGHWKSLETYVRNSAKDKDVEIWSGCFYYDLKNRIGKLIVPTHFWKLIKYKGVYEAYLIPNIKVTEDWRKYKVDPKRFIKIVKSCE